MRFKFYRRYLTRAISTQKMGSLTFYPATDQCWCLMAIERDGGLSTLRHSFGFACQQRVLKTFPDLGYLHSEDEIV